MTDVTPALPQPEAQRPDGARKFQGGPAAYDRHIGRYCAHLGRLLIQTVGLEPGQQVLDVGCGTGLLTKEIAAIVGADRVAGIDPTVPFTAACGERVPGADIRVGSAEGLPWPAETFDVVLSQLVLNFVTDPQAAAAEMRRVCRPGGTVAACVWDYAGEMTLLRAFWEAARITDPSSARFDESQTMALCHPDPLADLWLAAGLKNVAVSTLSASADYADFDDAWQPFLAGMAPSGMYVASLDEAGRAHLREEFHRQLDGPEGPFTLTARAWAVVGVR